MTLDIAAIKARADKATSDMWELADIDKLAYDFWSIHPRELDAWYKGDMPKDFKGGVRAWYFASKIRAALESSEAALLSAKNQNNFTMTDGQRLLQRPDVEGICLTPDSCFEDWNGEQATARCGPCAVKASALAGIETSQYTTSNPQAMKLQRELAASEAARVKAEQERAELKEALTKIAAYTDDMASDHLAATGSYGRFDECYSVETARCALESSK